jgi:phosphate/sulfate permease
MSAHSGDEVLPVQVRAVASVVLAQAVALLAAAAVLVVKTVVGHPDSLARALLGAAMALLGTLVLMACARGLLALRWAARTPIVVLELLALPVGYSLGFQAGLPAYGAPILTSSLAVMYLLFTPAARAALDRDREH